MENVTVEISTNLFKVICDAYIYKRSWKLSHMYVCTYNTYAEEIDPCLTN